MFKQTILATALAAFALPAMADGHMSWEKVTKQAAEEGEVSWFVWYFEDRFREFTQQFTEETGIKVTIPEGDHATNIDKMLAESGRDKGDIDVLALGFDRLPDVSTDLLMSLKHLPEDEGRIAEVAGINGGDVAVAYWGNQTGIAYDPAKIAEDDLPQNPEEFAAYWEANPGAMGFNYENGGSGPSFYMNILGTLGGIDLSDGEVTDDKVGMLDAGIEFFNKSAANYEITASNADSLTRLSDGEFTLVAAWEDHMAGLQNIGEIRKDLAFYIPEMGMFGGGNAVVIPKNAPNPAAAQVLVEWLASPDVQTQFNMQFGTAPMNKAADDSAALVSNSMRERQTAWAAKPFRDTIEERFIEEVIQER